MNFDAKAFMASTFEEANSTVVPTIPPGDYIAQLDLPDEFVIGGTVEKGERAGQPWGQLIVRGVVSNDPRLPTGRDKFSVTGRIFLDLTETGALRFGEGFNVGLGRLRTACGINQPGQPFAWPMLKGKMVKIKVGLATDNRDPTRVYNEIQAFAPAY